MNETIDPHQRLHDQLEALRGDHAFRWLPRVLIECLDIFLDRHEKYDRNGGCFDKNFRYGDQSAFIRIQDVFSRLEDIFADGENGIKSYASAIEVRDLLHDLVNYGLIHLCCRRERDSREQIGMKAAEKLGKDVRLVGNGRPMTDEEFDKLQEELNVRLKRDGIPTKVKVPIKDGSTPDVERQRA